MDESLCCSPETVAILLIRLHPNTKKNIFRYFFLFCCLVLFPFLAPFSVHLPRGVNSRGVYTTYIFSDLTTIFTVQRCLKKLELPYDSAIPLLGIYSDKTIIQKDTCTCMFIATLFTVTKTWKQLNVHRQMNDKENVAHMYNGILVGCAKG